MIMTTRDTGGAGFILAQSFNDLYIGPLIGSNNRVLMVVVLSAVIELAKR